MSASNLSPRDLKILFGLTIAVVAISLVFPMMGLGSTDADDPREIPTMEIETDTFDFAGEFPQRPDTQSSGELAYGAESARSDAFRVFYQENNTAGLYEEEGDVLDSTDVSEFDALIAFVTFNPEYDAETNPDDPYAVRLYATNSEIPTNSDGTLNLTEIDESNSQWVNTVPFGPDDVGRSTDATVETGSGDPDMELSLRLQFTEATEVENDTDPEDISTRVDYTVNEIDSPDSDSGGLLSGIPVVGSLFGAGSDVLAGVILLVQQIGWVFGTILTIVVNAITTIAQVFGFVAELVTFVTGGYAGVVAAAPGGLASIVLAFPGLLLGVQIIRLILVFVNTIWIG